jgi:hypothetical protein
MTGRTRSIGYRDTTATIHEDMDVVEIRVHDGVKTGLHTLMLNTEQLGDLLATLRDIWMERSRINEIGWDAIWEER